MLDVEQVAMFREVAIYLRECDFVCVLPYQIQASTEVVIQFVSVSNTSPQIQQADLYVFGLRPIVADVEATEEGVATAVMPSHFVAIGRFHRQGSGQIWAMGQRMDVLPP